MLNLSHKFGMLEEVKVFEYLHSLILSYQIQLPFHFFNIKMVYAY